MEAAHAERGSGPAARRNGISNEMVAILSMGVAILGVSLASWTTLHAEIADLRLETRAGDDRLRADVQRQMDQVRSDIGAVDQSVRRLDDRMRAVETRLAVVETRLAVVEAHTGSAAIASTGEGGEA